VKAGHTRSRGAADRRPRNSPEPEQMMSEQPPPIERHAAVDRFGKRALGAVHDITVALAEGHDGAGEPVLLRRNGPHRSIDELAALLDEALADDDQPKKTLH
jgi:hypothetical protein